MCTHLVIYIFVVRLVVFLPIQFNFSIYCGKTPQQNPIKKDQWENHFENVLKENETISDSKFDFKTDTYIEKLNCIGRKTTNLTTKI
jgi:hypothetical protein